MTRRTLTTNTSKWLWIRLTTVLFLILTFTVGNVSAADQPKKKSWGPDTPGEEELAGGRDPNFESVASHFPMTQSPREALGVPEGRDEFVLLCNGKISVSNILTHIFPEHCAIIYFVIGNEKHPFGKDGVAPDAKSLAEGYLPIVTTPYEYNGLKFKQTLFAWSGNPGDDSESELLGVDWSKNMKPDPESRLWGYVKLEVTNPGDEAKSIPVACQIDCGDPKVTLNTDQWKLDVPAKSSKCLYLKIPYDGTQPAKTTAKMSVNWKHVRYSTMPFCGGFEGIERIDQSEYEKCYEETAETWRQLCQKGMKIQVPEELVNNVYRAMIGQTFLCVDKEGDKFMPHDGAGFYEEGVWGVCAAVYCQMLDAYGYHEESKRYLKSIMSLVSPDGEFITRFGYVDHGALLIVLEEHYRYTHDTEFLKEVADTMLRACRWIHQKRLKAIRMNKKELKDESILGLMPYRPSGDFPVPDYNIMGDATACVGMEATVRALRVLGRNEEADVVAEYAASYRADLDKVIERSIFTHDGVKLLPVLPKSKAWLKKSKYGTYGYYSYFSSMLLESGYLPINDPCVTILKNTLEQRGGLILGTSVNCSLLSKEPRTSHGFAYGYWMTCLRRNDPRHAILGFYGTLALGMSRTTLGGIEHPRLPGETPYTIPHLRTDSQLLRLLRAMLIREDGDKLILAQATPRPWLQHGQKIQVKDAPTYFGPINYQIDSKVNDGQILVEIDPPKRESSVAIDLCLRHPESKPIRKVLVNGKASDQFTDDQITLTANGEPLKVEVSY